MHNLLQVEDDYCRHLSKSLVWKKDSDIEERGITTRELIVERDFMLQFKVSISVVFTNVCVKQLIEQYLFSYYI